MCWHSFNPEVNVNGQPRDSNMKILIVDDDIISRMLLMHLISACGQCDIVEAEDGLDA